MRLNRILYLYYKYPLAYKTYFYTLGPSRSNGRLINTWVIKQLQLLEETNGEEGNYININTTSLEEFTYTNMNQMFCFSSQSVIDWKVIITIN